jgi:hypothetical protein
MNRPHWLNQSDVQTLLHRLVDKLDKADDKPLRPLKLDRKILPALFDAEFESDKETYWSYLQHMQQWGWLAIKTDKAQPGKAQYELNPRIEIIDAAPLRQITGRPEPVKTLAQQWREAVLANLDADQGIRELIAGQKLDIAGKSATDIVERLNLLPNLLDEPLLLREVSARLFWGQSKVLDNRQAMIATLLNVDECPFPESPIQLQVYLPKTPFSGVLFIENLATFEKASRDTSTRFDKLVIVFASGFKGSAKRLRTISGVSVYFAAHGHLDHHDCQRFWAWLIKDAEPLPVWFWGDLDYSGMQIIKSLRHSFEGLDAWQPGYQPMLDELFAGNGHQPLSAKKSNQKPIETTGADYADNALIPALQITGRFLDQEF